MDEWVGKIYDVKIEDYSKDEMIVWADKDKKELIENVEGVHYVQYYGQKYYVSFDRRYNLKAVVENIILAFMIDAKEETLDILVESSNSELWNINIKNLRMRKDGRLT